MSDNPSARGLGLGRGFGRGRGQQSKEPEPQAQVPEAEATGGLGQGSASGGFSRGTFLKSMQTLNQKLSSSPVPIPTAATGAIPKVRPGAQPSQAPVASVPSGRAARFIRPVAVGRAAAFMGGAQKAAADPISGLEALRLRSPDGKGTVVSVLQTPPRTPMQSQTGTPVQTRTVTPVPSQVSSPNKQELPANTKGSEGISQELSANYIRLKVLEEQGICLYEVTFEPQVDSRNERDSLIRAQAETLGPANHFNGTILFVPRRIPEECTEVKSVLPTSKQEITIRFRLIRENAQGDQDSILMYNNLFRKIMSVLKYTLINRSHYNPQGMKPIPDYKLEVWPGYVTAVQEYDGGVMLQCDVSHRVLRTESALDIINDIRKRNTSDFQTDCKKALIGAIVLTRYNNKSYRIDDLDFSKSPKSTFTNSRGIEMTFLEYYKQQYGLSIRDENQPLLINSPKKTVHEKEATILVCLVPELCSMTGMTQAQKSNFACMKAVAVHTRVPPAGRQLALKAFIKSVHGSKAASELLAKWNLKLDSEAVSFQGRVLEPISIFFGKNQMEKVSQATADFSRSATSKPMLVAKSLIKWMLIFPAKQEQIVKGFFNVLKKEAKRLGMEVAIPERVVLNSDRTEEYLNAIRKRKGSDLELVVTVVPAQRADRYAAIKKLCYIEQPVASQVVVAKTISDDRKLTSVVQKIALQINCKLGGELWASRIPIGNDVMVIGIDVFHDVTVKSTGRSSIAGFVSSTNEFFSRWHSIVARQSPKQELVDAYKMAFIESCKVYHRINHRLPEKIIIFRDGIGDSQVETASTHEVNQLISTFNQIKDGYCPEFGFVVVQKKINTRIFKQLNSPRGLTYENPPPGTIVDHTITRKTMFDFFLVSQKVSQGTVTPTHCIVVKHDPKMTPDLFQKLSYQLTHMYFNWPGSVRVPAPCQYAHKLANMVGEHLHDDPNQIMNSKLYYL